MKLKITACVLQILLVGTLMLSGGIRDTWDFGTAAVHILTAGTLLIAFLYCLFSGEFFFPMSVFAAVTFGFFLLLGELTTGAFPRYFSFGRLYDALGMAGAGASLVLSAAAVGAIFAHLIRTLYGKIRTGHGRCPYTAEILLCVFWITAVYIFPLSVRFTEWDNWLDSEYLLVLPFAACVCAGVYGVVREQFLIPVFLLSVIAAGYGFFLYGYPEVFTTAHIFNFAECVHLGVIPLAPLTALAAWLGTVFARFACVLRDHAAYRREIEEYKKSK